LLAERRRRDRLLLATSVGPHREDWRLLVDGRDVAVAASRGQQRSCLVALLLLQVSYLEFRSGEKPLILLDDVLSELDAAHQSALFASITDASVLLTATHAPEGILSVAQWRVDQGAVTPVNAGGVENSRRLARRT
jgi:DNA replication and repair protein RecF